MRVAILNGDLPRFLKTLYDGTPGLASATYDEQIAARADCLVGVSDSYSRNFKALGHEAREIYPNNPWMQSAWAREHGLASQASASVDQILTLQDLTAPLRRALQPFRRHLAPLARRVGLGAALDDRARRILRAQIDDFNPDVILNQNIVLIDDRLMKQLRRPGCVIIAQHGVAPPEGVDYSVYNFAITMLPYVVEHFRAAGLPAEQVHLAFEPSVIERMPPAPEKDLALTFVGGIEAQYNDRIRMLEAIAERFPIELYLSGSAGLPPTSAIERARQKQVWGREMYRVLQRSRITLNSHIDAAREFAGNLRLFEATGVGTCLVTDAKVNLSTLFEPGAELETYASIDECLSRIDRLLNDAAYREEMAQRGQRKTLTTHTYRDRVQQILAYIARYGD
ncbi:MAG: glycosyltransferase [Alphaproteobacteria bacterium]|nr:glycosyltransferase [Alphaproteobacteria bacterium]